MVSVLQPPLDQTKEDTSISVHPISSHDSKPPEDAKDPDEREQQNPEPNPTLKPPED